MFDEEFAVVTREFFRQVKRGRFKLVTSAVVQAEIKAAPARVQDFFAEMLRSATVAETTEDALLLQRAYLTAEILTPNSSADALHVALATVSGCALIVSWNFRHIVHFQRIPRYNAVNKLHGYSELGIYSPCEVIADEDQDI
jgi:predicted nucleic acid-binding protein